jgi:hypothetical protein
LHAPDTLLPLIGASQHSHAPDPLHSFRFLSLQLMAPLPKNWKPCKTKDTEVGPAVLVMPFVRHHLHRFPLTPSV